MITWFEPLFAVVVLVALLYAWCFAASILSHMVEVLINGEAQFGCYVGLHTYVSQNESGIKNLKRCLKCGRLKWPKKIK